MHVSSAPLLFGLIFAIGQPVQGWAQSVQTGFYERKNEGWFWYKEELPTTAQKPKKRRAVSPSVAVSSPPPIPTKPAAPNLFSAKWFRENLPKYKDLAWDNPTVENVRLFLYLQRFAIDRSEQFSDSTELAVVGDPYLDEISRRPTATYASQQIDRNAGHARTQLLRAIATRVGIFFFFRSNDEHSDLQAPLIKMLEQREGFAVMAISNDGKALPSNLFPAYRTDNGHAKQLGVITYPALYLASPDGQFAPIGQGPMSLPEINQRILVAAKRNGWVSDQEFDQTRPLLNRESNIAERLVPEQFDADLQHLSSHNTTADNFIPPAQLMQYLRDKLTNSPR